MCDLATFFYFQSNWEPCQRLTHSCCWQHTSGSCSSLDSDLSKCLSPPVWVTYSKQLVAWALLGSCSFLTSLLSKVRCWHPVRIRRFASTYSFKLPRDYSVDHGIASLHDYWELTSCFSKGSPVRCFGHKYPQSLTPLHFQSFVDGSSLLDDVSKLSEPDFPTSWEVPSFGLWSSWYSFEANCFDCLSSN